MDIAAKILEEVLTYWIQEYAKKNNHDLGEFIPGVNVWINIQK
jgi:hypothetical protein